MRVTKWMVLGAMMSGCGDSGDAAQASETDTDASPTSTTSASGGPTTAATESGAQTTGSSGSDETGSTDDTGATGSDESSTGGDTDVEEAAADQVGIFSGANNYFELAQDGDPLKFHFGSGNSKWGASGTAIAGDWNGDGWDTVALYDGWARAYVLAENNDSDESLPALARVAIAGVPVPPTPGGEAQAEFPIAGDWDGDGVDGIGLYHAESGALYLIDDLATGEVSTVLTLGPAEGWPTRGWPLAGDWDGDGDDEPGLISTGNAYLAADAVDGPPATTFAVEGGAGLGGDWNGDGTDTIATFNSGTNTFTLFHHNGDNAPQDTAQLGHAEPGFWGWRPLAGRWKVPEAPIAGVGFDFEEADPSEHGIASAALGEALDDASEVANVLSVLVLRHGSLVGERYFHGYDRHIAGNIKSVSKSVLSALYGIAIEDGTLGGLEAPVANYLPTYFSGLGEGKQGISIEDMMTMRGGLEWSEGPSFVSGGMVQADNFVEFVLEQPLVGQPGANYEYSTGLTHLGSAALTEASGVSTRDFALDRLFGPLGISAARWDASPEGYYTGGAEMWMRPRDMARFGQLFLAGGQLDGERILTEAWVNLSGDPWVPESGGRNYGLWWRERNWSNYAANDSYFAWGYGGQFVFLFPSASLQVVVTSKWNVDQTTSGQSASAIFNYVDSQILPTVGD